MNQNIKSGVTGSINAEKSADIDGLVCTEQDDTFKTRSNAAVFPALSIGFIGAGKVGAALGKYFHSKGLHIAGYYSRNPESAQAAAKLTSSRAYKNITGLVNKCGLLFITTPDDQIAKVWDKIQKCNIKDKIICHTSGSVTSEVFEGIELSGASGYSLHPMYAFASRDGRSDGLDNAYFTIEGHINKIDLLRELLSRLGNKTIVINPKDKVLYHIANVMVSNLVLSLINLGCQCLEECGAAGKDAFRALLPLITGNIDNIKRQGFINSLTGPVERNDTGTISKHLDALPEKCINIYKDLSLGLAELSAIKHPERDYSQLIRRFHIK